jgi:hypothetical protein
MLRAWMTEGVIQKATLRANCNTHASQQIAKEVSRLFIRSRDVGYIRYHTCDRQFNRHLRQRSVEFVPTCQAALLDLDLPKNGDAPNSPFAINLYRRGIERKALETDGDASPVPVRFLSYKDPVEHAKEQIKKVRSHPWTAKEVPVRRRDCHQSSRRPRRYFSLQEDHKGESHESADGHHVPRPTR